MFICIIVLWTGFAKFTIYDILQVNVSISSKDNYCIDIVLRCLAIAGDGLEPHDLNDGGILGTIMAAGFKGSNVIKLLASIGEL